MGVKYLSRQSDYSSKNAHSLSVASPGDAESVPAAMPVTVPDFGGKPDQLLFDCCQCYDSRGRPKFEANFAQSAKLPEVDGNRNISTAVFSNLHKMPAMRIEHNSSLASFFIRTCVLLTTHSPCLAKTLTFIRCQQRRVSTIAH
jgi:hypothetical protein